jgi:[acyl-carrier-protein] S-malonyltransferase
MKTLALLFPGGGSHYVGMGKALCATYRVAKDIFEEAGDVLGYDLGKLCFEGRLEELSSMQHSQPAIFTASMAAFRVYEQEIGMVPAYAAGHSLGEYSALCAAGVIGFADALRIVKRRGELLQLSGEMGDKGMAAVNKADLASLQQEIGHLEDHDTRLFISVFNSEHQYVVAGYRDAIYALSKRLEQVGADVVELQISSPSHCPLMQLVVPAFAGELSRYTFNEPSFPVISNVTGVPYASHDDVKALLCEHLVKPVQWHRTMQWIDGQRLDAVVDIGPQSVLKNLVRYIAPALTAYAFDTADASEVMRRNLGLPLRNHRNVLRYCLTVAVSTKNYNPDMSLYSKGVVEPYNTLKELAGRSARLIPTATEIEKAAALLRGILETKGVPKQRIAGYLGQVLQPGQAAR